MVFKRDFTVSDALSLLVAQLQTQQVMTSQLRSHIKHLTQTYYIPVPILQSKLMKTLGFVAGFNTIWWWFVIVAYFFGPPCILYLSLKLIPGDGYAVR